MLYRLRIHGFIWLTLMAALACSPGASLIKKAHEAELSENYDDAAMYFYNALIAHPNNAKAIQGLKTNGQRVLNGKFVRFSKLVIQNKVTEAVKEYQYAQRYYNNALSVNVQLDWPSEYDDVYADIRQEYADKLFEEALQLVHQKKYEEAEKQFELISAIDTTYAGISVLRINTLLDAMYRHASKLMQQGQYKESVTAWTRLLQMDANFRDAQQQKQLAVEKATVRIGMFPIISLPESDRGFEDMVNAQLGKTNQNFTRVIATHELKTKLINTGWGINPDLINALSAAADFGLTFLIRVELLEKVDTMESEISAPREAYEAYTDHVLNPYTNTYTYITRFKKIAYTDSFQRIQLRYRFRYYIYDLRKNELLRKDEVIIDKKDEVHAFSYDGDATNLYQNLPVGNYLPPKDPAWQSQFKKGVRKQLMEKSELQKEAQKELAFMLSYALNKAMEKTK